MDIVVDMEVKFEDVLVEINCKVLVVFDILLIIGDVIIMIDCDIFVVLLL